MSFQSHGLLILAAIFIVVILPVSAQESADHEIEMTC